MTKDEWHIWVKQTSLHRNVILASEKVACYYCFRVYSPKKLTEWTDKQQTAVCLCGIDGVVPFNEQNTMAVLKAAHKIGFGHD